MAQPHRRSGGDTVRLSIRINLSGPKTSQRCPNCVNLTVGLVWRLREARSM